MPVKFGVAKGSLLPQLLFAGKNQGSQQSLENFILFSFLLATLLPVVSFEQSSNLQGSYRPVVKLLVSDLVITHVSANKVE